MRDLDWQLGQPVRRRCATATEPRRPPGDWRTAGAGLLLLATALSGCAQRLLLPDAIISRYEFAGDTAQGLRVCQVQLGWSTEELYGACGLPQGAVQDVLRPPGTCSLYRSLTHPLDRGAGGVHWVAVCHHPLTKESGRWVKQSAESKGQAVYQRQSVATSEVYASYGLAEGPTVEGGR